MQLPPAIHLSLTLCLRRLKFQATSNHLLNLHLVGELLATTGYSV